MTMPFERTRALRWAGEFLREIRSRSDVPADLKRQVLSILRHYPEPRDIKSQARLDELRKDPLGAWLEPEPTTEVNSEDLAAEAITRIIFIDLDGVLHATSGPGAVMREYVWLPELLDLVAGHANVGLVVHGSARQRSSEEFLRERMALSVPRWCGTTDPRLERWPSIQAWLQQHPEVRDFLVLDDQPGEFPTPAPAQLIVCDGRTGLSDSAVQNKVSSWLARTRLADLAVGYSEGAVSWLQVSRETGLSFGELLVELGRQGLQPPPGDG